MRAVRGALLTLCATLSLAGLAGCVFGTPLRLRDGGGGSLLSAGVKITGSNLTGLTQDEVQFVTDFARAAESSGFGAIFWTEHPAPTDDWLASGGHDAPDPFDTLMLFKSLRTRVL